MTRELINSIRNHIQQVHSARNACIYCQHPWDNTDDWENELHRHIQEGQCPVTEPGRRRYPECMTAAQEDNYRREDYKEMPVIDSWVALYARLFPREYPIPMPDIVDDDCGRSCCRC